MYYTGLMTDEVGISYLNLCFQELFSSTRVPLTAPSSEENAESR